MKSGFKPRTSAPLLGCANCGFGGVQHEVNCDQPSQGGVEMCRPSDCERPRLIKLKTVFKTDQKGSAFASPLIQVGLMTVGFMASIADRKFDSVSF